MAKKSKRYKKQEDHISESWLVPYADILTLLLALFIILFSSSSMDQEKMMRMSQVFSEIFDGGTGFMDENAMIEQSPIVYLTDREKAYLEDQKALEEIKSEVENFIAVNELENTFATSMTDGGLLITIRDSILFDPGKADIKPAYLAIADELSQILLMDPPRSIVITGHTDNVPQIGGDFNSNWDLSVMRAVNFLETIIARNPSLDPKLFSVKGYGEYNPITSNETVEGRSQNRRVEVLIEKFVNEDGTTN